MPLCAFVKEASCYSPSYLVPNPFSKAQFSCIKSPLPSCQLLRVYTLYRGDLLYIFIYFLKVTDCLLTYMGLSWNELRACDGQTNRRCVCVCTRVLCACAVCIFLPFYWKSERLGHSSFWCRFSLKYSWWVEDLVSLIPAIYLCAADDNCC